MTTPRKPSSQEIEYWMGRVDQSLLAILEQIKEIKEMTADLAGWRSNISLRVETNEKRIKELDDCIEEIPEDVVSWTELRNKFLIPLAVALLIAIVSSALAIAN